MVQLAVPLRQIETPPLYYPRLRVVHLPAQLALRRAVEVEEQLVRHTGLPLGFNNNPVLSGLQVVTEANRLLLCVLAVNPPEPRVFVLFLQKNCPHPDVLPQMLLEVKQPLLPLLYAYCIFSSVLNCEGPDGGVLRLEKWKFAFLRGLLGFFEG